MKSDQMNRTISIFFWKTRIEVFDFNDLKKK